MKFWKMHGIGNDYIILDNRNHDILEENIPKLAQQLCERRFSVGADGLILAEKSETADIKMRIFNSDGSEAEMCGNGIRCLAKYCYENKLVKKEELLIETLAGLKKTRLILKNQSVSQIVVNMGIPIFEKEKIPMHGQGKSINERIIVDGRPFQITCLSMGNPHCIIFVNDINNYPVDSVGPIIENHSLFPNRINVVFVEIVNQKMIKVRVWERGVGETLACGTGACAAVVVGNILEKIENKVTVKLKGGDLEIQYNKYVKMKGPAEKVFEGKLF